MGSSCRPREVCVVGAGMSGLAAARELRREGHAVTVMEQSGDVGGQWLYDPRSDGDDPLGAKAPVKVHSSMYASARVISPRECMGFSDFQFVPRPGGRDARRFPSHREVHCYLRDFCEAFGLADAIRLNTRVVRVAMQAPPPSRDGYSDVKWKVRSVHVEPADGGGGEEEEVAVEDVFDAVVVANGHYSQPRLPSIAGMDVWQRRRLHSHSYREPGPFRGEAVVVIGCGDSGMDIATELCGVAREVHLAARSVEAATTPPSRDGYSDVKWKVRSVHVEPADGGGGEEEEVAVEDVFDAVVVANGHYSQPRLPSIAGMDVWQRRRLHSHSYREPGPFRGEAVVVIGCGDSGMDIATELCGVAREVHLAARSVEAATTPPPMLSKILASHAGIHLHPQVDRLCEDGRTVAFADGCRVVADAVIYCTGYTYSFPFLDTAGLVTVRDNRVGPLYEHTFPPALAPSLSFVGVPMRVFAPWLFEAQARWVALVLSGKVALPPEEDMLRAVQEEYRAREIAGVPTYHTHAIPALDRSEIWEFVYRHSDLPRMEDWKAELFWTGFMNAKDDRDTFRDREDDSENVREGVRRWRCVSGAQYEAALAAARGGF